MRRQLQTQRDSGRSTNIRIDQRKEFATAFFTNHNDNTKMPTLVSPRRPHQPSSTQTTTSSSTATTKKLQSTHDNPPSSSSNSLRNQRKQFPIAVQQNLDISASDVRLRASQLRALDLLAKLEDDCKVRRNFVAQHHRPDPFDDDYDAIANAEQGVLYIPRNLMDEDLTQVRKPGEFDSNYADILTLFLTKDVSALAASHRTEVGKRPPKMEDVIEDVKIALRPDESGPQPPKEERKAMLIAQYQRSMYRLKAPKGD